MRALFPLGLVVLVAGLAGDVLVHAFPSSALATAIGEQRAHLASFVGMVLSLAGLMAAAAGRSSRCRSGSS